MALPSRQPPLGRRHRARLVAIAAAALRVCIAGAQTCSPDVLSQYLSGWPKTLDMGVYWYGHGDQFQKAIAGQKSAFFDPKKPTIIYFHGWTGGPDQQGWVVNCKRVTTRCPIGTCPQSVGMVSLIDNWLVAGWNVGYFYWDQFADEECERDAEQKLWFDRKGNGLRWKSFDVATNAVTWVQMNESSSTDVSMASMAVAKLKEAMETYAGPSVRFVGHSIGSQLAAQCADSLHDEGHPAAPQRIAMLEPFFTRHHLYFWGCKKSDSVAVGGFAAQATEGIVRRLYKDKHVVTEIYKSSPLTQKEAFGYPAEELAALASVVIYEPTWCGSLGSGVGEMLGTVTGMMQNLGCYHAAVMPYYFLQYGMAPRMLNPPPPKNNAVPGSALFSCSTPSSSCTDGQIREWIERQMAVGGSQRWEQQTGMQSFNQSDDSFKLTPDLMMASEMVVVDPVTVFGNEQKQTRSWLQEAGAKHLSLPSWLMDNTLLGAVLLALAAFCCGLFGILCICSRTRMKFDTDSATDIEMESGGEEVTNGYNKVSGNSFDSRIGSDYEVAVPLTASRGSVGSQGSTPMSMR